MRRIVRKRSINRSGPVTGKTEAVRILMESRTAGKRRIQFMSSSVCTIRS